MSGFPERYDDLGTDLANFLDEMLFAVSEEWIQKFLNSYAAFLRDPDRNRKTYIGLLFIVALEEIVLISHVLEDDPRLEVADIKYPGEKGDVIAHFAKPKSAVKLPGVVIIQEIYGLVPHIKDVTRRVALKGFLAVAPDALSPFGGTPDNPDVCRSLMQKLDAKENLSNFVAAVKYLKTHPNSTGKVGVIGFCWGGGVTNQVAVSSPDVQAAVPFYGRQAASEDVPKIKASLLIHYAGEDARINEGIPAFEAALKESKIEYKIHMYEGALHGFFNDTSQRYHAEASKLAWERTIAFLNEKLT